ncbi:MAG TPA: argininosuccinate synthase [Candidatus Handelsmanbacteria bacterium]|nr:argininosuccinate synthase [Candidatus Handelsmanbacteria bacterium]
MELADLKNQKIMLAVSGGLDSCTITHWLVEQGVEVVAYTADLGQPDEKNIEDVRDRMLASGASEMILEDLIDPICRVGLQLVQSQARYEGGYWNTTGIARHVTVAGMLPHMQERGIHIMGHGATGRGNDQVRFQLAAQMLSPQIEVYAPWRDPAFLASFGGRKEMIDYCQGHGLPITATHDKPYSTDANILGLTHEAGQLEDLTTPVALIEPGMGTFPQSAPDTAEVFTVRFAKGDPVSINGEAISPRQAIEQSNAIGGRHGIGIGLHAVENRFVGIKSRGVYEAPALELLGQCYEYLLQLVLDRRARKIFSPISAFISEQIYQGYWFDTATQASWKLIEHLNGLATGTISVSLYKGQVAFHAANDIPHSLYSEDTASMEDIGDFDHKDSEGFLGVLGVSARALNQAGQTTL